MNPLPDDALAIQRSSTIEKILLAACRLTGMRFAAVARVTADRWLACAVRDEIAFGLEPGGELEVQSTLCSEVATCGRTIAIDHVAEDPVYRDHHTPSRYGFQSYISTPILQHGEFFGTLCALDPEPATPRAPAISATFELFADLIGRHLETQAALDRAAALVELGDRFRDLEDPASIAFAAAEILGRTLAVDRSGYADVDAVAETTTVERDWTAPGISSIVGTHHFRMFGSYIDQLKRGEAVVLADARQDSRTADTADALTDIGARAVVNLPVVEHGRLVAILFLNAATPRRWLDDELVFVRDVADRTRSAIERRRAERELRRLNTSLEAVVVERTAERDRMWDTSPDLMLVIDFEGVFRRVNPAWTTLLGYTPDELVGHHVTAFVLPHDHGETIGAYQDAAAGERAQLENRYRHKDGSIRWIAWVAAPAGDLTYATGRDITGDRARAGELRRYRDIVASTASPICAFDTDFRLVAFNPAHNDEFRRVNGFDTRIGDVFPDLFVPEQRETMRALMTRALAGERFTIVEEFGRPELGIPRWEISYSPLRNDAGQIIGAFHSAIDISDRQRAEAELAEAQEALRQSQKLEAMGSLTGGVAHDLNNLLTPIMGSLDLLHRRAVGTEREQRLIDGALQSAERAKTVVQRLLAFARRQPLQSRPIDIGSLVAGLSDLIDSTCGPRIRMDLDIDPAVPAALADANQIEMALLNLAVNARDAMPDGGVLTIAARTIDVPDAAQAGAEAGAQAGAGAGLAASRYVSLSVADTGTGMDAETLKRAVEPFYSTKGIGKGTGLGLSMAHGLAAQLGGALRIASTPGVGTEVALWLPVAATTAADGEAARGPVTPQVVGTVLLVDDEDLVRSSTAEMLTDLGYRVLEAASAEAALTVLAQDRSCDLLITDHLMPGMNGTDLIHEVRRRFPRIRSLIVSGYAEAAGVAPDLPRLTKPFRQADLASSLAAMRSPLHGDDDR